MPDSSILHYLPDLLKFLFTESMMPSNHLVLYHPLLLLPSIFPSIRVFSNDHLLSEAFCRVPISWSPVWLPGADPDTQHWQILG